MAKYMHTLTHHPFTSSSLKRAAAIEHSAQGLNNALFSLQATHGHVNFNNTNFSKGLQPKRKQPPGIFQVKKNNLGQIVMLQLQEGEITR